MRWGAGALGNGCRERQPPALHSSLTRDQHSFKSLLTRAQETQGGLSRGRQSDMHPTGSPHPILSLGTVASSWSIPCPSVPLPAENSAENHPSQSTPSLQSFPGEGGKNPLTNVEPCSETGPETRHGRQGTGMEVSRSHAVLRRQEEAGPQCRGDRVSWKQRRSWGE